MTMPIYYITITDKIKAYRNENNLSLKEFGKLIDVSAQAVCKWEQNTCYPDISFLTHLARILGCKTDDFFVNQNFYLNYPTFCQKKVSIY